MKVHKLEILVIDFENYGVEDSIIGIEENRHLNATVIRSDTKDIGEWDDNNLLNNKNTRIQEFNRIFNNE